MFGFVKKYSYFYHIEQIDMKSRLYILALLPALFACTSPARMELPQEDPDQVIVSDRLSNQRVNSFAEDSDGHIWIATFRGLNKYSVHEFHQYFCSDDQQGLPDNQVNAVFSGGDGSLWAATVNGVALRTEQGGFRRIPILSDNASVSQILETPGGAKLFSNGTSLFRYDAEEDVIRPVVRELNAFGTNPLVLDGVGRLWLSTGNRLDCYSTDDFSLNASVDAPFTVYHVCYAWNDELWVSGMGGLGIYDTRSMQWKALPEAIRQEKRIMQGDVDIIYAIDDHSILLHVIGQGMFFYYRTTGRVLFQDDAGFPFDIPDSEIRTIFRDSRHNLWFGTTDQGYGVSYNYKDQFNSNKYLTNYFSGKSVTSLAMDSGRLWICTLLDGLYLYDIASGQVRSIEASHLIPDNNVGYIRVSKVFVDSAGDVWLLFTDKFRAVRCRFDGRALRPIESLEFVNPLSIAEDDRGCVWIGGGASALLRYDRTDRSVSYVPLTSDEGWTFVTDLLVTEPGRMLAAAFNHDLIEVNTYTLEATERRLSDEEHEVCIRRSVMVPNKLFKDGAGDVWTGTVANGVLRSAEDGGTVPVPGAPCLDICSIEQDRQGNIWISTMNGLGKYDRTTGEFVNYFEADGIGGNQFSDRASCLLPDGTLVFGGTHGLTWFNPLDVPQKRTVPLVFEDLKVHNVLVRPEKGGPIEVELSRDPDILIKDWQNGFSISFAALDYSEHERTHYYYMMEGFDRYWVDAGNTHEAYYANLPAGSYTFKVRITNNNRSIVETEKALDIRVLPPWYRTWWFRILLAVLLLTLAWNVWRAFQHIRRVREEAAEKVAGERLERERVEAAHRQEKELARIQMNYFSNIAHEFRTPLTMIAGPASQLADSPGVKGQDRQLAGIIRRNSDWMLSLVNQLLDFNRIGNSKLQMKVAKTDIVAPLRAALDMFRYNAESKGIELGAYGLEEPFVMWADVDKVNKIVMNLLANALKFTPSGGKVSLSFDVLSREAAAGDFPLTDKDADSQYACISVTDSGCGIPEGQEEKIFERFYQAGNQGDTQGSGIGLYYSRALTGLHHGYIRAWNRPEGGARFSFILPAGAGSYTEDERTEIKPQLIIPETARDAASPVQSDSADRKRVAVVDDDIDIANYVKVLLSPYYDVTVYFDGASALKGMSEEVPNLIVSDVVMPGMSGYELCKSVKSDIQLSHIPVVLVTAKVAVENQVEGLGVGADAYVTKPFQPAYLLALVKSLLENREKLHRRLGEATSAEEIAPEELSPRDKAFLKDLYSLMETEIADAELDITRISEKMRMSRTKFYYKVKGLTGENPGAFFKRYKLNFAANLLKEGKYNMSEIAYMTGFSTLSHFSTSFKKQFGVPPSEYTG